MTISFYSGATIVNSGMKFGTGCLCFPSKSGYINITNTTKIFNISPLGNYEFECFIFFEEISRGYIFQLTNSQLCLAIASDGSLYLTSVNWHMETAHTNIKIPALVWHHILLRITGGYAYVFVDGTEELRAEIGGTDTLEPITVQLGPFFGYIDEFVFRRNAGSGAPIVPRVPYDNVPSVNNNALVTRSTWSCRNLPNGLQLSTNGILSGHPTTSGTYNCDVTVSTNWGTDTKTIKIVVK